MSAHGITAYVESGPSISPEALPSRSHVKNECYINENHKICQMTVVICFDDLILLLFLTVFIEIVKAANDFN